MNGPLECLGALDLCQHVEIGASGPKALLIRVTNPGALAASQAGFGGAIASALLPETVQDQVLTAVKQQLSQKLAENGVLADIAIVSDSGAPLAESKSDLLGGVAIGAGAIGAIWALKRFVFGR